MLLDYRYIFKEAERHGWVNPRRQKNPDALEAAALFGVDTQRAPQPDHDLTDFVQRPAPAQDLAPLGGAFRWSDFDDQDIPDRRWVVSEWVGQGHVTSLYGRGGIGKSLLAQQLATCVVTGQPFLGIPTTRGRVLALFCEDDRDELRRRAAGLNRALGTRLHDIDAFEAHARVGMDNVIVATDPKTGMARPTAVLAQIRAACAHALAQNNPYVLIILDNAGQVFSVSENDRNQVTQALGKLAGLAADYNVGVLLLGHPAKGSDSQYSGSTAWEACVRSRLFIGRPKDPKTGVEIGSKDDRVLSQAKANYAATEDIELVYKAGAYVRTDMGAEAASRREAASLRFQECLDHIKYALAELAGRGISPPSSERTSRERYLPRLLAANDLLGGFDEKDIGRVLGLAIQAGHVVKRIGREPGQRRDWAWIELPAAPAALSGGDPQPATTDRK